MTAFDIGIAAIFRDPNMTVAAVWRPGGIGEGVALNVVRSAADKVETFAATRIASDSLQVDVRVADAPTLDVGDTLEIEGKVYQILGAPLRDPENLTWQAEARPDAI